MVETLPDLPPKVEVAWDLSEVPLAVQEKARDLEQLLVRWDAGEAAHSLQDELVRLRVRLADLARLWTRYQRAGQRWEVLIDGRYGHPQKANSAVRGCLFERKQENPELTGAQLSAELEQRCGTKLSLGYVNTLLRRQGLSRGRGRGDPGVRREPEPSEVTTEVVDNAGLFFLEGAKQEMDVVPAVEQSLSEAGQKHVATPAQPTPRVVHSEAATKWHKLDHLLYLPVLGLRRPYDLQFYQADGLKALYGFTYKYQPLEHFLGDLARLQVGEPLAWALAGCYSRAWYPQEGELTLYIDWHVKPHWTKYTAHCVKVAMWGRVMPGCKQLLVNGSEGHLLLGLDHAADKHFSHVLVDLEAKIEKRLGRKVALTVVDGEGGGLPTAESYAAAERSYLSVLLGEHEHPLADFVVLGEWEAVEGDEEHEAVDARWVDPKKAAADPRRLVLMRRRGGEELTRIYAGCIPAGVAASAVPGLHRGRWQHQEMRIRELVNGANLNENYGYGYEEVPNRTEQRRYEKAVEQQEASQRRLDKHEEALGNLERELAAQRLRQEAREKGLREQIAAAEAEAGEGAGPGEQHCRRRLKKPQEQLARTQAQGEKREERAQAKIAQRRAQRDRAAAQVSERQEVVAGIDTESRCRERCLEKDQIMLNLQVLLGSLHHHACENYFAPGWQRLELETATSMVYRKPGRVTWRPGEVEVVLQRYRYPQQQAAMEETCRRFNARNIRWRDGRLLRIHVAGERFQ